MSMVVLGPQVTNGVPKNNNASDHGNTNRLVSPADIYAAQKLARECVRKKYKGCWAELPYDPILIIPRMSIGYETDIDLSDTTLRGHLRRGQEGSEKGI
jgi:hypothetical protein